MDLPMELVIEVLARLPVKSLVRFRSVCKAWHSLISSPDFTSLHFCRYHDNPNTSEPPFLATTADTPRKWTLISSDSYEKLTQDDYAILNNQHIMDPFAICTMKGCSVHGLLLLSRNYLAGRAPGRLQTEIMLWNPMIGKTHRLPPHGIHYSAYLGLGFCPSTNDFKVVAIETEPITSVYVYSLSTNAWTTTVVGHEESVISNVYSNGFHLLEGTIHFVSNNFMEELSHLVMFDVKDEVLSYVEMPAELGGRDQSKYPVSFRDKIAVVGMDRATNLCNLWLIESSHWKKAWTIDLHADPALSMLGFKKTGQLLVITNKGLKVYDLESGQVKRVKDVYIYCTPYKESLVLL